MGKNPPPLPTHNVYSSPSMELKLYNETPCSNIQQHVVASHRLVLNLVMLTPTLFLDLAIKTNEMLRKKNILSHQFFYHCCW